MCRSTQLPMTNLALRTHTETASQDELCDRGHGVMVKRNEAELGAPITNGRHVLEVLEARGGLDNRYQTIDQGLVFQTHLLVRVDFDFDMTSLRRLRGTAGVVANSESPLNALRGKENKAVFPWSRLR